MKKVVFSTGISILVISLLVFVFGCMPKEGAESAEAAAKAESPFKDIKIYAFVGGEPGDPFGSVVQKGAEEAERVLDCDVTIVYSGWLTDKFVQDLRQAIAAQPDGICFMGHAGEDATKALIDDAEKQGIIVTTQNVPLPNFEAKYGAKGFGYVGQVLYDSGYLLGKKTIEFAGAKAGDKAFVWGVKRMPGRGDRTQGLEDACVDAGLDVTYLEGGDDIMNDPNLANPVIAGYLAENPDAKVILPDFTEVVAATINYLRDNKVDPDKYTVGVFDLNQAVAEAVKEGYVDVVSDQQPYLQGFLPVVQVCLTKKYGFAGLHIDTGTGIVTKEQIDYIETLVNQGYR